MELREGERIRGMPEPKKKKGDEESSDSQTVSKWLLEIELYESVSKKFSDNGESILRRYKGENALVGKRRGADYNVLWSNVQNLKPIVYSRTPKPKVRRRFRDKNPVGRAACEIVEKSTDFVIRSQDFDSVAALVRDDYLLVGRGQGWARYAPLISQEDKRVDVHLQVSDEDTPPPMSLKVDIVPMSDGPGYVVIDLEGNPLDPQPGAEEIQEDENGGYFILQKEESVVWENVIIDYVPWKDFGHEPKRVWEEVTWVYKRVLMTKDEVEEFYKEVPKNMTFDKCPPGLEKVSKGLKEQYLQAEIYEIWNKKDRKVYHISPGYKEKPLMVLNDPLGLVGFFPCPKPLLATTTSDSLIPIADYYLYEHIAAQIDQVTGRIERLTRMIKIAGVRDPSAKALDRIFDESVENRLIPVTDWATWLKEGGIKNSMDMIPIDLYSQVLIRLYDIRDRLKADLYELTGMSDIIRGNTSPNETATAQQIKGQYASLRVSERQREFQRWARDLIAIVGEIIVEHFDPQTMKDMSGIEYSASDSAQLFDQAYELVTNEKLRTFQITIETDSTIAIDEQLEKSQRTEFVSALSGFLKDAIGASQTAPQLVPLLGQILMFAVRGYNVGRELEPGLENELSRLEELLSGAKEQQEQPQQPQGPSPEEQAASAAKELEMRSLMENMARLNSESAAKIQKLQEEVALQREKIRGDFALQAQKLRGQMSLEMQKLGLKYGIVPGAPTEQGLSGEMVI